MAYLQATPLSTELYFGTLGMFLMATGIVIFVLFHQRKVIKFQLEQFKELKASFQGPIKNYIMIDIDEKYKALFVDIFKVFEDYSHLRGHKIRFSIDNSIKNKLAYKITFQEDHILTEDDIKNDINELIDQITNDKDFSNLPVILSPFEHSQFIHAIKGRMSLLQHNYNLQKYSTEFYKKILDSLISTDPILHRSMNLYISGSGNVSPNNFVNSSNVIQGNENSQTNKVETKITIKNSFNERKEQIDNIEKLIELVKKEEVDNYEKTNLINKLTDIKDELSEFETPDVIRISKWLIKIKKSLEKIIFSHDTIQAFNWLFQSFDI